MVDVDVHFDTREGRDALAMLRREGPKAVADALTRVGFEALDALEIEVRGAFPFASQSTTRFLGRSFFFDKATPENLRITVKPKAGAPGFLAEHTFGDTIEADKQRLTFAGKLAVPINVRRGARGRVRKTDEPGALLEAGRGGFATPRAILQRTGGRRVRGTQKSGRLAGTRLMYLLLERPVKLAKRLRFFEVIEKTARAEFPKKAASVLEKINLRRGR